MTQEVIIRIKINTMFLTISYISNASSLLDAKDVEVLLAKAKEYNNANDIRGILIYSDNTFFQVLEGETDVVQFLYENIKKDFRHHNVFEILKVASNKRSFKNYDTKFITYYKNRANVEIDRLVNNFNEKISNRKLHSLVTYQSKALMSLY